LRRRRRRQAPAAVRWFSTDFALSPLLCRCWRSGLGKPSQPCSAAFVRAPLPRPAAAKRQRRRTGESRSRDACRGICLERFLDRRVRIGWGWRAAIRTILAGRIN